MTETYTLEHARRKALEFYNGDELAVDAAWLPKYALRDLEDNFLEETPLDSQRRIARELHRKESQYPNPLSFDRVFALVAYGRYASAQGSPMAAIGDSLRQQSLSNCFVIDSPSDSYGGICRADQELVQIAKRRGGVGIDVSNLRPNGAIVHNASRTSAGVVGYMKRYSNSTREVGQMGRRGALMLTIDCRHPDLEEVIAAKMDRTSITGANISIKFHDEFFWAVENDAMWTFQWPVDVPVEQAQVVKTVKARGVWNKFIAAAHAWAEPGALFWSTLIRESIADCYAHVGYKTVSTNPCGELPLSPYDSCRLFTMNLMGFVVNAYTSDAYFDFESYLQAVQDCQRLMDDLVDLELEAIQKIIDKLEQDPEPIEDLWTERNLWYKVYEATSNARRTGLGNSAVGDAIAALGLKYDSLEAVDFIDKVYMYLAVGAEASSVQLAFERGAFPVFDFEAEKDNAYLSRVFEAADSILPYSLRASYEVFGRRSISPTTTAPVGTTSMGLCVLWDEDPSKRVYNSTSGIEPVAVALETTRYRKLTGEFDRSRVARIDKNGDSWEAYRVQHPGLKAWSQVTGETDITKSPYWKQTSSDIDWLQSVAIQAAAQRWVSHAISKTCNLPENAPVSLVSDCYLHAWKSGCKGFTVYREGSRDGVITRKATETDRNSEEIVDKHAAPRPTTIPCVISHSIYEGERICVLVGLVAGRPYELFVLNNSDGRIKKDVTEGEIKKHPRANGIARYALKVGTKTILSDLALNSELGTITRLTSLSLRHGVPVSFVVEQLAKSRDDLGAFSRVLSRALKGFIADGTKTSGLCEGCGSEEMTYAEGCQRCNVCGASKCY